MKKIILASLLSAVFAVSAFADTCSDQLVRGKFSSGQAQVLCATLQSSIPGSVSITGDLTVNGGEIFLGDTTTVKGTYNGASVSKYLILAAGNASSVGQGAYAQLQTTTAGGDLLLGAGTGGTIDVYNASGNLSWSHGTNITQDATNGGSVVLSKVGTGFLEPYSFGLTATGANIGTAVALTNTVSAFATVAASTGATLPDLATGTKVTVLNGGANALSLYPINASGTINGGSAGAAISVAAGGIAQCVRTGTNPWFCGTS